MEQTPTPPLPAQRRQYRWELLLKEMEFIQNTIKNLDDIIYKTKNFGFLFWGGSLYLIVEHLDELNQGVKAGLILLTGLIPILFWLMDYRWRKHLLQCSQREKHISYFLNSDAFEQLVLLGEKDIDGKTFPLFDIPGWIYTIQQYGSKDSPFLETYLIDTDEFTGWKVFNYKDAKWYYGTMLAISVLFGVLYGWNVGS